jgi:hypothetical protein
MKHLILIAGAVALASTTAAYAKPGNGHGNSRGVALVHGKGHGATGYGVGGCPPGLAKKGCVPPGQAKKLFGVGQRVPYGYNGLTRYGALPYSVRSRYQLDPYSRYIYRDDYLYRVDPATMVVSQILRTVL